jgi:hypothetical protein
MNFRTFLPLLVLSPACALGIPPPPTAPDGTFEYSQQKAREELQQCQQDHPWDERVDAGVGALPTADDDAFSKCLKQSGVSVEKTAVADAGQG